MRNPSSLAVRAIAQWSAELRHCACGRQEDGWQYLSLRAFRAAGICRRCRSGALCAGDAPRRMRGIVPRYRPGSVNLRKYSQGIMLGVIAWHKRCSADAETCLRLFAGTPCYGCL